MKKIWYVLLLNLVEAVLFILLFEMKYLFSAQKLSTWWIKQVFADAIGILGTRALFYLPLYVLLFLLVFRREVANYAVLKIQLFNVSMYIALSLMYSLLLPFAKEYFVKDFFYLLIVVSVVSPLFLKFLYHKYGKGHRNYGALSKEDPSSERQLY